jgi:glutamyl-tRNA reductase
MHLVSYSIIFTKVGTQEEKAIRNCKILNPELFIEQLKLKIDTLINLFIIQKCNGTIVFLEHSDKSKQSDDETVLEIWSEHATIHLQELLNAVSTKRQKYALRYILESALGLHSVTPGDSQVYSQIRKGICSSSKLNTKQSLIYKLYRELPALFDDAKKKSKIFRGNISAERIACNEIQKNYSIGDKIAIIGFGLSGKLMYKILAKEKKYLVDIYNRTLRDSSIDNFFVTSIGHKYNLEKYKYIIFCVDLDMPIQNFIVDNFTIESNLLKTHSNLALINLTSQKSKKIVSISDPIDLKFISKIANETRQARIKEFQFIREIVKKHLDKIIN